MPEHPKAGAEAAETGRPVVVLDGTHRGEIGIVLSAGGGVVVVKIAGVAEPLSLPASSVGSTRRSAKVERPPRP